MRGLGITWRMDKMNLTKAAKMLERSQTEFSLHVATHGSEDGDGGLTWMAPRSDPALIEPICQGAIRRCRWAGKEGGSVILFSNPASRSARVNLTVRASFDDGDTWPVSQVVHPGPSGYSDLAVLANGEIGCLFEAGEKHCVEEIRFTRLPAGILSEVERK